MEVRRFQLIPCKRPAPVVQCLTLAMAKNMFRRSEILCTCAADVFFLCLLLDFVVSWHLKTSVKITFDAVFACSRQILLLAFSQGLPVGIYAYAGPHGRCCLARHSKLGLSSLANENFRFPKFISSAEYSSVEWFQATKRESNIILRGMERWALKQNRGWISTFHRSRDGDRLRPRLHRGRL